MFAAFRCFLTVSTVIIIVSRHESQKSWKGGELPVRFWCPHFDTELLGEEVGFFLIRDSKTSIRLVQSWDALVGGNALSLFY